MNDKKEFINTSIEKLKHLYRFSEYDYLELKIIMENYDVKNIIGIKKELEHDGYDRYGPKSNLWDLKIIHIENNKKYLSVWHREDWYTDQKEEYSLFNKRELNI